MVNVYQIEMLLFTKKAYIIIFMYDIYEIKVFLKFGIGIHTGAGHFDPTASAFSEITHMFQSRDGSALAKTLDEVSFIK